MIRAESAREVGSIPSAVRQLVVDEHTTSLGAILQLQVHSHANLESSETMLNTMARRAQACVNQTCSACTKTDGREWGGGKGGGQVIHLGFEAQLDFKISMTEVRRACV